MGHRHVLPIAAQRRDPAALPTVVYRPRDHPAGTTTLSSFFRRPSPLLCRFSPPFRVTLGFVK